MSNAGQAVLGIVGAVVGFFVGGPTGAIYGFQLGYLAGTAIFPTQLPHLQGPRLGDGQQTVSIVGQPIPIVFGTQTVGGNIIWASPIREVANNENVGGKGGPQQSQTTYTYFRSFAILLCEGPIAGVRRIWANGKLVLDHSPPAGVDRDDLLDGASAELLRQLGFVAAANADVSDKITIYLGTEDQLPDPVIESFEGVGNVPAHRGYAYVVFDDVELKPEDGNRIPASWKFEVYEDGEAIGVDLNAYSNEVLYPWALATNPENTANINVVESYVNPSDAGIGHEYASVSACMAGAVIPDRGYSVSFALGATNGAGGFESGGGLMSIVGGPSFADGSYAFVHYAKQQPGYIHEGNPTGFTCANPGPGMMEPGATWYSYSTGLRLTTGTLGSINDGPVLPNDWDTLGRCAQGYWYYESHDTIIRIRRSPGPPPDPCEDQVSSSSLPAGYGLVDGQLVTCGPWTLDNSQSYLVLQEFSEISDVKTQYPLNPTIPVGHANDTEEFWTEAYEEAVALGRMDEGLVYGVDYPATQGFGYRKIQDTSVVDVQPVSLASIVSRLCDRVGLQRYDVSDLEDKFVIGYQVSRTMVARAAIEPLRQVGFFDAVESTIQLKFPTRGKATIASLVDDDLGAHFASDERPPSSVTTKKQELELPRQIRVHYQNPQRDYDPGEELSPARFDTAAESVVDVDLAVAITPDQAARIAEVLYRDLWAGRWTHSIAVDQSQSAIEPADCIIVPIDGQNQRMRVPALTDRLINLRQLQLLRDDDGSYESTATGVTSQRPSDGLALYGPIELLTLDLPALDENGDDAGFYIAARPLIEGGNFRGAVVSRSVDGNAFEMVASLTQATPVGLVVSALPTGPTTIFDEGNELRVSLQYGDLESRTEADVLAGANAAAVGVDGRWEIVQFKNAVNVAGSVWSLTGLLRGRRGTEHALGSSIAGDRFVLLSAGTISRVAQAVSDIGLSRDYRAVVVGGLGTAATLAFTGNGVALKPFSPVHLAASRDDDGNIEMTWIRRDRLGTDLDVPLSEDVEDYEVDVLNSSDVVLRTLSLSVPLAPYTTDQQITDFGSVQVEDTLRVRVYQISVAVGRGYPTEATL